MSQNPPGMDPMTASYKPENRKIAQDQSGNWKFVDTGQNVYHGGFNVKGAIGTVMSKMFGKDLKGKYGLPEQFTERDLGSSLGYELDEEEFEKFPDRRTVPKNIIQRWKENRQIKKAEQAAAEQAEAQSRQAATDQSRIDRAYREDTGSGAGSYAPGGGSGEHAADVSGSTYTDPFDPGGGEKEGGLIRKAYGGRIGYNRGRVVNPGGYQGEEEGVDSVKHAIMLEQMDKLEKMIASGLDSDGRLQARLDQLIATPTTGFGTGPDLVLPDEKAYGGRIGYRYGDPVIPEDETEDVFEIMRDQNIPISEQVEGDAFQMRIQELMGKGLSYDDAYDIAEMEFQDLFSEGSEQDQGLASLV